MTKIEELKTDLSMLSWRSRGGPAARSRIHAALPLLLAVAEAADVISDHSQLCEALWNDPRPCNCGYLELEEKLRKLEAKP